MDGLQLQPGQACGFVSAVKEILRRFVTSHFPIARNVRVADASAVNNVTAGSSSLLHTQGAVNGGSTGSASGAAKTVEKRVQVAECVKMRDELLAAIDAISLPPHFLDGALPCAHTFAACELFVIFCILGSLLQRCSPCKTHIISVLPSSLTGVCCPSPEQLQSGVQS